MEIDDIIRFIPYSIFFIVMILSFIFSRNRSGKEAGKMAEIAAGINGRLKKSLFMPPSIEVDYKGSRITINYFRGGNKSGPPHLDISLLKKPPFRLSVTRKSAVSQILNMAVFLRKVVTTVPGFDSKFLIQTSDRTKCLIYLSDYRKREIIESLYADGWQVLFERSRIKLTTNSITGFVHTGTSMASLKPAVIVSIRQVFAKGLRQENYMPILDTLTAGHVSGILEKLRLLADGWV